MSDGDPDPDDTLLPPDSTREAQRRRENGEEVGDLEAVRESVDDNSEIPDTPSGYENPYLYVHYHSRPNMFALDLVLFALGIGMFFGFGKVFGTFQEVFDPTQYTVAVTVTATVITFVVHELLHAITAKALGTEVRFGLSMTVLNTWTSRAFQSRRNTALIAIMPSVIITAAVPVILTAGSTTLAVAALVALFVNTVGLRHDVHLVWQMALLPRGALIYNLDDVTLVYEQKTSETGSPTAA